VAVALVGEDISQDVEVGEDYSGFGGERADRGEAPGGSSAIPVTASTLEKAGASWASPQNPGERRWRSRTVFGAEAGINSFAG
jgi:hypothetical protein